MLAEDLQQVARRLVICGMHVHVGIEDDDLQDRSLGQAAYFLPHLARALDLVALLARRAGHGAQILPAVGVRRAAAHRHAPSIRELERI